jgi:hypothetical protein
MALSSFSCPAINMAGRDGAIRTTIRTVACPSAVTISRATQRFMPSREAIANPARFPATRVNWLAWKRVRPRMTLIKVRRKSARQQ